LSGYLDRCAGSERAVLASELAALDRACRHRYGVRVRPEADADVGAEAVDSRPGRGGATRSRPANWPSFPGLNLVEILGSGGMGVVFKARQTALNRDVAVKVLRDLHLEDAGLRERFHHEARAVARLQHPHLVQVYEFGQVSSTDRATPQPYLVLEYLSGGNLADRWRGSPQPPREAARLVETLALAIHYAHEQGVVHRDLKPANVLLHMADPRLQLENGPADHPGQSAICHLQSPRSPTLGWPSS
jgi:serine/threonine protein kinase